MKSCSIIFNKDFEQLFFIHKMKYISLTNSALSVFVAKPQLSELSGSSMYKVYDNELVKSKYKYVKTIENKTVQHDYAECLITDKMTVDLISRLELNIRILKYNCRLHKFTSELENDRLERLEYLREQWSHNNVKSIYQHVFLKEEIRVKNCRYTKPKRYKSKLYKLNKSKVRAKLTALFDLPPCRRFMAFYSISFPQGNSPESISRVFNKWLTWLRKNYNIDLYLWVQELQKNKTVHYHMFTPHNLPIKIVNRAMAMIIENEVKGGLMKWGNSSFEMYNGVDVDSIYNSKRHKKSGKILNPAQIREWLSKYVTKYVTKNFETFTSLAWHCSRLVSRLFTSTIYEFKERRIITDLLPRVSAMYEIFKTDFVQVCAFRFKPVPIIYEKIRAYNNIIYRMHETDFDRNTNNVTLKTLVI